MSTPIKTRAEFQQLAVARLEEAKVLLDNGKWAGAYYLAGYAVECALKACIAKLMRAEDFPDKDFAVKCYTHNIESLIALAGLKDLLDAAMVSDAALAANRWTVKDWSEAKRYHSINEAEARALYAAIEEPAHGILSWLRTYWIREQIDGGRELLDQLAADGVEVTTAFWAKETESGLWYLFIASPAVDEQGIRSGYGLLVTAVRNMPHQWIDPMEVKLLRSDDVMAAAALRLMTPTTLPTSYRSAKYYDVATLGGVGVDGAYIYPHPHPAPAA